MVEEGTLVKISINHVRAAFGVLLPFLLLLIFIAFHEIGNVGMNSTRPAFRLIELAIIAVWLVAWIERVSIPVARSMNCFPLSITTNAITIGNDTFEKRLVERVDFVRKPLRKMDITFKDGRKRTISLLFTDAKLDKLDLDRFDLPTASF